MRWMIYGANGYTGTLVARAAAARGERPVLAGRTATAVRALADELGLAAVTVDLADPAALRAALADVQAVALCAGPFSRTSAPVVEACLATGTHYLDVTGEIPVFEAVLARGEQAAAAGVALVTGAGFDVVPTDCLAALLAAEVPAATALELAFLAPGGVSRGTATTGLEITAAGGLRRVDGVLRPTPFGQPARDVPFPSGTRRVGAVSWGDLVTAYHGTGIGDITVYTALPVDGPVGRVLVAAGQRLLGVAPVRAALARAVRRRPAGPSAQVRAATGVEVWAEVRDRSGATRTATLTGPNAYDLTADAVVRAVGLIAEVRPGAHTPATAFGARFVEGLAGVTVTLN